MDKKVIIGLVVAVVILGGGFFAAKSMMKPATPASTPAVQPTTAAISPSVSSSPSAMQTITVSGSEFAFTPSTLTVKKGEEITLTFKNTGQYPHNFTVTELGIKTKTVQPGEEDTITFTPDKTGSFTYICTVPGHADRGMKGTLTVE